MKSGRPEREFFQRAILWEENQHRGDMKIFYNMDADEETGQPREGGGNR